MNPKKNNFSIKMSWKEKIKRWLWILDSDQLPKLLTPDWIMIIITIIIIIIIIIITKSEGNTKHSQVKTAPTLLNVLAFHPIGTEWKEKKKSNQKNWKADKINRGKGAKKEKHTLPKKRAQTKGRKKWD